MAPGSARRGHVAIVTVRDLLRLGPRVSGTPHGILRDSLCDVNVPRCCCRPGCSHYAVATLTFVYSDSTAVIGPLATSSEPHSWDLCIGHAGRITAPRGWDLVRHAGPLPVSPDEDDLVALANAVREASDGVLVGSTAPEEMPAPAGHAPVEARPAPVGRRRGHLRVLPDPPL